MYQLTELFQKIGIAPSPQVSEFLVKAGFKIDFAKGLISGTGTIDGQTFNPEEALTYLASKTGSALAAQEQASIQQPVSPSNSGNYEVKSAFNLSVEEVMATGNQQLNEAAMSGYQVGVASADLWEGGFGEGFLRRKAEHQLYNVRLIQGLDRAMLTGTNFEMPEIAAGASEGKFRPSLPQ